METKAGHHHEQQQEEEETIEVSAEAQVTNRIAAHAVEVAGAAGELPPGGSCWVNLVLRARRELVTSAAAERGKQKDRFTNELRGEVQSQLALEWVFVQGGVAEKVTERSALAARLTQQFVATGYARQLQGTFGAFQREDGQHYVQKNSRAT